MNQRLFLAGSVVLLHIAALWALQAGLLRRVAEIVVPVQILSEITPPPALRPELPKPPPPARTPPRPSRPPPVPAPAPQLDMPALSPAPSTPAPTAVVTATSAPPATTAPVAAPVVAVPPPPPKVELPSSSAAYLNNPAPAYPALSRRLGEQGKVVLRVLIGADGSAQKAEVQASSGFERLDRAALATVLQWRFAPGKRGGVPESMWYSVPISFVLE